MLLYELPALGAVVIAVLVLRILLQDAFDGHDQVDGDGIVLVCLVEDKGDCLGVAFYAPTNPLLKFYQRDVVESC